MWQEKDKALYREFKFGDFKQAFSFMQAVAVVAEKQKHHPRWQNEFNKVEIWLSTHESDGQITDKDHRLADTVDKIFTKSQTTKSDEKNTSQITEVKMYADGGSRGNPGPSASGYVLLDMQDKVLVEHGIYLGVTTNNQAEYKALKFGLEEALKFGAKEVHVFMDSLLVVNQMLGKFKVRHQDIWPIHDSIKKLLPSFEEVNFTQVPREQNKLADAMVNKALDEHLAK
jgi:ribonuclease HI/pterin-4a-carbinolamine dehydratase